MAAAEPALGLMRGPLRRSILRLIFTRRIEIAMRRLIIAVSLFWFAFYVSPAAARVERIEIESRRAFVPSIEFGAAGAYEKLRGRAWFALDPDAAANAPITDLKL